MSTNTPATPPTTTLPERLARLQFNAALAVMSGDDMELIDAAATLEAASDLLAEAIAVCRWLALDGGGAPGPLREYARAVVRRADAAVREDEGGGR